MDSCCDEISSDSVSRTLLYGRRDRAAEVCTEAPNYSSCNYFEGTAVSSVLLSIGLHLKHSAREHQRVAHFLCSP